MEENLGIFKPARFGGFDKDDVLAYTKKVETEFKEKDTKIAELEAALTKAVSGGASAQPAQPVVTSSPVDKERIARLEEENKNISNKLNNTTITLKKLEEALQSEKKARQSEKMLYETERSKGMVSDSGSSGVSNEEITKLKNEISSKDTQLKDKEKEIIALKKSVTQKDNMIQELNAAIEELKAKTEETKPMDDIQTISQVFIEAQNTANKLKADAKAETEKTIKDAEDIAKKTISDAEDNAKDIIAAAEGAVNDMKLEVNEKAKSLDDVSEGIRKVFKDDLDKLKSSLKEVLDTMAAVQENVKKTVADTDKKIDEYSKSVFDTAAFNDVLKKQPVYPDAVKKSEPVADKPKSNPQKNEKTWAMDDLEALTKQVEMKSNPNSSNQKNNNTKPQNTASKQEGKQDNNKQGEKWKSDLAELAKQAEIDANI